MQGFAPQGHQEGAARAREALREIPIRQLVQMMKKAADLYKDATLPMGDGQQSPDDFARQQSASTGLPEHMCKANMTKNHFVLSNMDRILDCLPITGDPARYYRAAQPVP